MTTTANNWRNGGIRIVRHDQLDPNTPQTPGMQRAAALLADVRGGAQPSAYTGAGSCYVEFGGDRVGRVDVDFLSGPSPTGSFIEPSVALVGEKRDFGSSRRARWFGL